MASFWSIITLIPKLLSFFKTIMQLVRDWQIGQIEAQKQEAQQAVDRLKDAKTEKEREDATKDIARGSF